MLDYYNWFADSFQIRGKSYSTNQNITINFTAWDDVNLSSVKLYVNGVLNQTNASGINNTDYIFNLLNLGEEDYTIYGKATDNASQIANTSSIKIIIDTTNPLIELIYPTATNYSTEVTELNYTVIEEHPDSCWITSNFCYQESVPNRSRWKL